MLSRTSRRRPRAASVPPPVQATLRLESEMRNQHLARQIKCQPSLASILRNIRRGLAPIEECDIALCELRGLIVLDHRDSARNLKQGRVRIHAREAKIAVRPLVSVSAATVVRCCEAAVDLEGGCREPVNASGAHPTDKVIGFDSLRLASASRAEQRPPRLKI